MTIVIIVEEAVKKVTKDEVAVSEEPITTKDGHESLINISPKCKCKKIILYRESPHNIIFDTNRLHIKRERCKKPFYP